MKQRYEQLLDELRKECKHSSLREKALLKKLKEYDSQKEIAKAHALVDEMRRMSLHVMSEKEQASDKAFRSKHFESCQRMSKCSSYEYVLTGTGIGTAISVRCPVCGEEENITDYDNW